MGSTRLLEINKDGWKVVLAPEIGGSIVHCEYKGQHMMRPASDAAIDRKDVFNVSSFPLVPNSNRIELGQFSFGGKEVKLDPNMGNHPHNLHGQGWLSAWNGEKLSPSQAMMLYYHPEGKDNWPWQYTAEQIISVEGNTLTIETAVVNFSNEEMPVGLGNHPYFNIGQGADLQTSLSHVWEATNECIPTRLIATPEKWDFSKGKLIDPGQMKLDHCFAGWSGQAVIRNLYEPHQLRIVGDANQKHAVIYTPQGKDFFCFEPVTNMNNAFNRSGTGVEAPGTLIAKPYANIQGRRVSTITKLIVEPCDLMAT